MPQQRTAGFQGNSIDVRTTDGLDDMLLDRLIFVRKSGEVVSAPVGGTTDGLSTPKIVRVLPGYDATGDDWLSGVIHDSAYRNQLEVFSDGVWVKANYTQAQADKLILEAMKSQGIGFGRRHTIYFALRFFGWYAFAEDRKNYK